MNIPNPASVIKNPLRKCGFPGIYMSRNSNVPLECKALQVSVRQGMCW